MYKKRLNISAVESEMLGRSETCLVKRAIHPGAWNSGWSTVCGCVVGESPERGTS